MSSHHPYHDHRSGPPADVGRPDLLRGARRGRSVRPSPREEVAVAVHEALLDVAGYRLVGVTFDHDGFEIASCLLSGQNGDPLASLVGWRAPDRFQALGIAVPEGRFRMPEGSTRSGTAFDGVGRLTVMLGRCGQPLLVGEDRDRRHIFGGEPSGPVADVLLRCLGRPTPPPEMAPSAWVEACWLDAVAERSSQRPGRLTWHEASLLHPFAGGESVEPESLAVATMAAGEQLTWARLRVLHADRHSAVSPPPDGQVVAASDWFDDGSFARWMERDLPPLDATLDVVLATVPDLVAIAIMNALVAT